MAKNDNLKDFLTDIADAIRAKKGTTKPINPQNFSDEIASINVAKGNVSKGDVTFYDYDGTILYVYDAEQFLILESMPDLPSRKGLICQGWNWALDSAKAYVQEYGVLDIGATYITDDNNTRLYITIAAEGRMDVPISFQQDFDHYVVVDWGDGSASETYSGTSIDTTHHYESVGDYVIALRPKIGTLKLKARSNNLFGNMLPYASMLKKVEFGRNVSLDNYIFRGCRCLSEVVIPNGISFGSNLFCDCCSLSFVVLPKGASISTSDSAMFRRCSSLSSVVFSENDSYGKRSYICEGCVSLSYVMLPNQSYIGMNAFQNCYSLSRVVIPNSVTVIESSTFNGCTALPSMTIPKSVIDIRNEAFMDCGGTAFFDFSTHEVVPTLGSNAFSGIPSDCKIIVPDSLYDEWIVAENWSSYASQIVKASEYNG